jgi:hypothetical protein
MALPVNERQAATISPEAAAFLRSQPSLGGPPSFYNDIASPAQVPVLVKRRPASADPERRHSRLCRGHHRCCAGDQRDAPRAVGRGTGEPAGGHPRE